MPLLSIWKSNPDTVSQMSIEQVVATAGNGRLLDDSDCSSELREYLSQVPSEKLGEYADYCLTHKFDNNGKILQDVVNELGRRLDYDVTNGRYQGAQGRIGNDGLWLSPEKHHLVVEVKTTDAYSISLDTIAQYRKSLQDQDEIGNENSMLLVVGRYDTGQLEAQVRGSRHAWDMRLISIDSLVKLVNLKENTEDETTSAKIRSVLIPMEYTRLDRLIDVLFTATRDVENVVESDSLNEESIEPEVRGQSTWVFTETKIIEQVKADILATISELNEVKLVKKSPSLYWTSDRSLGIACTISKQYEKNDLNYWYAYHAAWDDFLSKTEKGFFALGCVDLSIAFVVPYQLIHDRLPELNTTIKNGKPYWHIKILKKQDEKYYLLCPVSGKHLDLTDFALSLVSKTR